MRVQTIVTEQLKSRSYTLIVSSQLCIQSMLSQGREKEDGCWGNPSTAISPVMTESGVAVVYSAAVFLQLTPAVDYQAPEPPFPQGRNRTAEKSSVDMNLLR